MSWRKMEAVVRRDLYEMRSSRLLAVWGLFGAVQCLLMMVSKAQGRIEDTSVIFWLGGVVGVIVGFDIIAREREHRTLDLLLTQGISRPALFAAKWGATLILCAGAAGSALVGGVVGAAISGKMLIWGDFLVEFGMVFFLLEVYATLGLLCSVVFRRGKWALTAAAVAWGILRPPVVAMLLIKPLESALHWSKGQVWQVVALVPEFAFRMGLDGQRGVPEDVVLPMGLPYVALAVYVIVFSVAAGLVFVRQDEPVVE